MNFKIFSYKTEITRKWNKKGFNTKDRLLVQILMVVISSGERRRESFQSTLFTYRQKHNRFHEFIHIYSAIKLNI